MKPLACSLLALLILAPASYAQDADSLMERFASAWTRDDAEAVRQMLADDVVVVDNDALLDSPDAVIAEWGPNMEATGSMTITPIRSGATDDALYQVGRWTIDYEGGQSAGSHHFTFRETPDGAYRLVAAHIRTDPAPVMARAAEGEPVVVMVNRIAADKRESFEAFIRDFQADLAANLEEGKDRPGDREAFERTRFLVPTQPNEDSTYTYVFLADPYVAEADYGILDLLRLRYDEEEAQRRYRQFTESFAAPQEFILLEQTER